MSTIGIVAGIAGAVLVGMAFQVPNFPSFKSPAFLARPERERKRRIRLAQWSIGVFGVLVGLVLPFALGFLEGQERSQSTRAAATALVRQIAQDSAALDTDYMKAEETIRLDEALTPERLVTRAGIADARQRLAKWTQSLDRWEAGKTALAGQFETRMMSLDMAASEREAAMAAFRKSYQESKAILSDFIAAKREGIAAANEMLDLVDGRFGRVRAKDGGLVFADPADARRSNALAERLEAAGKREEAVAKTLEARARAFQEKLQKFEGK